MQEFEVADVGRFPTVRMRRNRRHRWTREMVAEQHLTAKDFIWPVFVHDGPEHEVPVPSMPGVVRYSLDAVVDAVGHAVELGIPAIALFPATDPSKKTPLAEEALNPDNLVCQALRSLKHAFGNDVGLLADVALDPYSTHGQDGIVRDGYVVNDETLQILCRQAVVQAEAGCDITAPSDMMDGRVQKIRERLEADGFIHTGIISYSAKFSSSYYGPFRDAVGSKTDSPVDKSGYQLCPANFREARRELALDASEGADILMVKPAEPYLDVISHARNSFDLPIAAYQVSGEYSRLWAAHMQGWLDLDKCALESLISIKRAGANLIFTYFAERISRLI